MIKTINHSIIKGTIAAPASKSMMQRAIAIATLAKGKSTLYNYTPCNDSDTALKISKSLGATVSIKKTTVTIDGGMNPQVDEFSCGEAGLGIRMFTPIASLWNKSITLHGEGSLKKRPISMLEKPMTQLGVDITTNNGFVPITVHGPLLGKHADVDGSISSQMLTGMLIALPLAVNDTILNVKDLTSKPYIDMTLDIIKDFGITILHDNYKTFTIHGNQNYKAREYNVEGDWSGASFLLVAGALGGEVIVSNIRSNSLQADLKILEAIKSAGAIVECHETTILVKGKSLDAFEFDATECPDLFPPLVALACHCKGISTFKGVCRLKHKESDRATVLKTEFAKIGTKIEIDGDTMFVYGKTVTGGKIHANNDHRIAMAAAVTGILTKKPIEIENAECIAKSYPGFYDDFAKIGGIIS